MRPKGTEDSNVFNVRKVKKVNDREKNIFRKLK